MIHTCTSANRVWEDCFPTASSTLDIYQLFLFLPIWWVKTAYLIVLIYVFLTISDSYIFIGHLYFFCELPVHVACPFFYLVAFLCWLIRHVDFFILEGNVMCKTSQPGDANWMSTTGIITLQSGKLPCAPAVVLVLPKNEQIENRPLTVGTHRILDGTSCGPKNILR